MWAAIAVAANAYSVNPSLYRVVDKVRPFSTPHFVGWAPIGLFGRSRRRYCNDSCDASNKGLPTAISP
jgi:hypothetical protein